MKKNENSHKPTKETTAPPSSYGGIAPNASKIPGNSIDEHRSVETANILLTGDEIRQQNENM